MIILLTKWIFYNVSTTPGSPGISWNLKTPLEVLEISWNLLDLLEIFV